MPNHSERWQKLRKIVLAIMKERKLSKADAARAWNREYIMARKWIIGTTEPSLDNFVAILGWAKDKAAREDHQKQLSQILNP